MAGPWTTDDVERMARNFRIGNLVLLAGAAASTVAGWLLDRFQLIVVGVLLVLLLPLLVLQQRQAARLWHAQMTDPLADEPLDK